MITNRAVEAMLCALLEPDVGHVGESQPRTILNCVQKGFMKGCYAKIRVGSYQKTCNHHPKDVSC